MIRGLQDDRHGRSRRFLAAPHVQVRDDGEEGGEGVLENATRTRREERKDEGMGFPVPGGRTRSVETPWEADEAER